MKHFSPAVFQVHDFEILLFDGLLLLIDLLYHYDLLLVDHVDDHDLGLIDDLVIVETFDETYQLNQQVWKNLIPNLRDLEWVEVVVKDLELSQPR